ncbi:hypothetical protein O3I_042125 [Nocardia brasiliensis ATCC 700358]|uniref:Uncharacterized protein n=1 Tax=Nocardia brasiliensis (strain ATCC 700358 / HUJEG-1) TaxID=1133849 RepID=K0FAA7_NOCB7|nr:hypothetical protein O3I_042125 [Nocardia brasiliensis ATCC 700358]
MLALRRTSPADVGAPVEVAYGQPHPFVPDWMFGVTGFEAAGLGARRGAMEAHRV